MPKSFDMTPGMRERARLIPEADIEGHAISDVESAATVAALSGIELGAACVNPGPCSLYFP
jgi:hypothetical protein